MVIISLNVDDNAALAEAVAREKKLTVPVLVGGRLYWEKNFPPALPMSWLIDREGRRSDDPVRPANDEWVNRIFEELQKAAAAQPAAAAPQPR